MNRQVSNIPLTNLVDIVPLSSPVFHHVVSAGFVIMVAIAASFYHLVKLNALPLSNLNPSIRSGTGSAAMDLMYESSVAYIIVFVAITELVSVPLLFIMRREARTAS